MDEFQGKLAPFIKEYGIALSLSIVGLICVGYGLLSLSQTHKADSASDFPPSQTITTARPPLSPPVKQITIDIEGSVQKPGVYKLPSDSRIQNALIIAGGLSGNADRQQVSQNLNLAAPLTDGAKIYIPAVGEQMTGSVMSSNISSGNAVQGASAVNINQASESELDALAGVGPVTAQKIISNRPYASIDDLISKKVVGQSVYGKIKDFVTVY